VTSKIEKMLMTWERKILRKIYGSTKENVQWILRWINDVEDDLRKLGVKRWRTKALDRVEWASIVREAKAKLKGP
jgi:hypothetical protein